MSIEVHQNIAAIFPLTPMQQGMLFHTLSEPEQQLYFEQISGVIRGPFDPELYRQAWQRVLDRHDALRAAFIWEELDQPLQVIGQVVQLPWEQLDWRGIGPREQQEQFERFLQADRARGFDFTSAPLLRQTLIRLGEDEYRFVSSHHHILLDGWSVGMVFDEVLTTYDALWRGAAPQLGNAHPYQEYVAWLQRQDAAQAEEFWRATLKGFGAPTLLPFDQGPAAQGAGGPATAWLRLSEERSAALQAYVRRHGLTLNTLVQGAWALLLSRYSGSDDVLFGMTVAGRPADLPGVETTVGLFINTLPLRVRVDPAAPLAAWLQQLQDQQVAARQYEYSPLAQIQRLSAVAPGTPLFEYLLVFENFPMDEGALAARYGGAEIEVLQSFEQINYPLTLEVQPGAQLRAKLTYDPRRLEASAVERLLGSLETLLEGMLARPAAPLCQLPLLSAAEQQQMLRDWNATEAAYPRGALAPDMLAAQAARTPEATALEFGGERLSYGALDRRANQLARALQRRGVGPDALVGIQIARSVELVVAILGVLKAGGAYIPLDPAYPPERLAWVLDDARPAALLTAGGAPADGRTAPRLDLLADRALIEREPDSAPAPALHPDNLAYVLYTSGSTGRPKGVMIHHSGLSNYLRWATDTYRADEGRGAPVHSPVGFDLTVTSLFTPLLAGRTVTLLPDTGGTEALEAALRDQGDFSLVKLTPAHVLVLNQSIPAAEAAGSARALVIGGEALTAEMLAFWRAHAPATRLINEYGPTETVVGCCVYEVQPGEALSGAVPIGRPIANTQLYILDRHMQPAPVGAAGELYIGGAGVARGYLGRPDLTAERFVPNPFGADQGRTTKDETRASDTTILNAQCSMLNSRLYRTGDLARYRPDGVIEYLGRIDDQVKIRGFRIELGEIEATLGRHPGVREAAVLAREDVPGARRLVAYIVPADDERPTTNDQRPTTDGQAERGGGTAPKAFVVRPSSFVEELKAALSAQLPEYMVPSAFVLLEALPLTPNGKVDRKALPAPEQARPSEGRAHAAPRTSVEATLAAIWADVLCVERVGIHDNFFELGGDSILSLQIIARAAAAGLRLTPRQLFQHRTVAALAPLAVPAGAAGSAAPDLPEGELPLIPIQRWFFEQELEHGHHWNQAVLMEARVWLSPAQWRQAVGMLIEQHDALRLRFSRGPAGWRQSYSADQPAPFERVELTAGDHLEQTLAAQAAEWQASLDLERGPIARFVLFDLGPSRPARLLIAIHHLAVDGVSWRVLLEDLETICRALSDGVQPALPAKTSSYKRWAERLVGAASSPELRQELAFWQANLRRGGTGLAPELPAGSEANTVESERVVTIELDAEETRALLQEVPKAYRTQINDVLLTALALAFAERQGARTLQVDLEGHGREPLFDDVDLSRTVGWFTSMFPVVLDLGDSADGGAALKTVKEQLRRIPQNGVGYGILRYLAADAPLAGQPQSSVSFNYLGQFHLDSDEGLFKLAAEPHGPERDPRTRRSHALEVGGSITGGRLHMSWAYSDNLHRRATVEGLAEAFLRALRALIAHCRAPGAGGYTPSDFPLAAIDQPALDRLGALHRTIEDIYPLAPMQQGMLFHSLSASEPGVYVEQMTITLRGELDLGLFRRAWERLVERQSMLRTAFVWEGLTEPQQIVFPQVTLPWEQLDWRGLAPDEQRARLERYLAADRRRGFRMDTAPLLRVALVQIEAAAWHLIWSFHHALLDGWSVPLLFGELFEYYHAFRRGAPPADRRTPRYRDYIAWLQRQDLDSAQTFWRNQLRGFSEPTPLPGASSPGRPPSSRGQHVALPESSVIALRALSRQHGLTLNTLMQGAWALLLSRYSGADEVLFGTTVAGRPADLPGVEEMVGLFINTQPVRVQTRPDQPLLAWLTDLQEQQVEARQYEYTPLSQIQTWSEAPRGQALFESIVVFENYPGSDVEQMLGSNLTVDAAETYAQISYPLALVAESRGDALQVNLVYNAARFEDGLIRRMLEHFLMLLEAVAAEPDVRLAELPRLPAAERRQVLAEWNVTAAPAPVACLHELIAAQAARTPDAAALVFDTRRMSYAELDRRANQLARRLQRLGVGPDTLVGVCVERSPELVVALLGVLKAGGAYLPLDPNHPSERLAWMLEDTRAPVVITRGALRDHLPPLGQALFDLDLQQAQIAQELETAPPCAAAPESLAYVIYTSGSTGRPKGTLVPHRGLGNVIAAQRDLFGLDASSRVLQFAALTFDASVFEIVMALGNGACLVIPTRAQALPGPDLVRLLQDQAVSIVTLTPTTLAALPDAALPALRTITVAGEACPAELVARWAPGRRFFNLYGPTETTIWASAAACAPDGSRPPIGGPIANTQLYVLDAAMQPAPVGAAGELYIGGAGVTRGYLGRPDLTAERFVPNPFGDQGRMTNDEIGVGAGLPTSFKVGESSTSDGSRAEAGDGSPSSFVLRPSSSGDGPPSSSVLRPSSARLYKTGDLVRWRDDGQIEFLGRIDAQVKVRGFRIELGEIEAALRRHPSVRDVAVVAREDTPGDTRLVAYVVLTDERRTTKDEGVAASPQAGSGQLAPVSQETTGAACADFVLRPSSLVGELRAHLQGWLPDYMLPSAFVALEALPLSPSGKLDRRALPAPEQRGALQSSYIAPRTPLERQIALVWEEVLGVQPVGLRDGFFELGGHSLLAVRTASALQQRLGQPVSLALLLQEPTVEQLARALQPDGATQRRSPLVALQAGGPQPPFFCVHPGSGEVFEFSLLARLLGPDRPFYGIRDPWMDSDEIYEPRTVEQIAAHYLAAVRELQPEGPYLLGGYSFGGGIAYEMARQLSAAGQEIALLAVLDTKHPYASRLIDSGDKTGLLAAIAEDMKLGVSAAELRAMAPEEQIAHVLAQAQQAGAWTSEMDPAAVRRRLDLFKQRLTTAKRYEPLPAPVRIALFRACECPAETPDQLAAIADLRRELLARGTPELPPDLNSPSWGWEALSSAPVEVYLLPGSHATIMREPHVQTLAQALAAACRAALPCETV